MTRISKIVVLVLVGMLAPIVLADAPELPKGLKGFAGMLKGKVVSIEKHGFVLEVDDVTAIWKHSKADNPQAAVGNKLLINVGWKKDGDKWIPIPTQMRLVHALRKGDVVEVDVNNDEGNRLHIMELTKNNRHFIEERGDDREGDDKREGDEKRDRDDKRERDEKRESDKKERADRERDGKDQDGDGWLAGIKGFSGLVRGVVRDKTDDGIILEIFKVKKVWKNNKARNPEALAGHKVIVLPRWVKEKGRWNAVERHAKFIKGLKVGDEIDLEILHDEGEIFHILELNEEQRKKADSKS